MTALQTRGVRSRNHFIAYRTVEVLSTADVRDSLLRVHRRSGGFEISRIIEFEHLRSLQRQLPYKQHMRIRFSPRNVIVIETTQRL